MSFKHGKAQDKLTACEKKLKALTKLYKKETGEVNIIDTFEGVMYCEAIHTDPNDANKVFLVTDPTVLILYDTDTKTQRKIFDA